MRGPTGRRTVMRARGPARPPGGRPVSPWRVLGLLLFSILVLFRITQAFTTHRFPADPDATERAWMTTLCVRREPRLKDVVDRPEWEHQGSAWVWRSSLEGPPAVTVVCRVEQPDGVPQVTVTRP